MMLLCIITLHSCRKNNDHVATPEVVDGYVAGVENNGLFDIAKYWKNGIPVNLSDGFYQGANSIVVSGSDVYVVGWVRNGITGTAIAVYWKNGSSVKLMALMKLMQTQSLLQEVMCMWLGSNIIIILIILVFQLENIGKMVPL